MITPEQVLSAFIKTREANDPDKVEVLERQRKWLAEFIGATTSPHTNKEEPNDIESAFNEYLTLRASRSSLKAAYERDDTVYKKRMSEIENWLAAHMDAQGVTSLKISGLATTFFETETKFTASDWDEVRKYILATGDFSILNKALNSAGIRGIVGTELDMSKLPGVSVTRARTVQVRKA